MGGFQKNRKKVCMFKMRCIAALQAALLLFGFIIQLSAGKKCHMPREPKNGYIVSASGTDKLVQYRCNPGYKIAGASYNYCVDGLWTAVTPKCKFQYTDSDEKPMRINLYAPPRKPNPCDEPNACADENSICKAPYGNRKCFCKDGWEGNPYMAGGCELSYGIVIEEGSGETASVDLAVPIIPDLRTFNPSALIEEDGSGFGDS